MYDFINVEKKWQELWNSLNVYKISNDINSLSNKPKYYILDMFPYPSGYGLHVGHLEGYTASDVISRYKKMKGFNVLHPMGWDSFGLPTERAAFRENKTPSEISYLNINNFKKQINRMGYDYDWSREINTSDENYYKWTQWIFIKLFEKKLAYYDYVYVNWCPSLNTVLSNEEVKNKRYIETGDLVKRKLMKQWILKITDYSEKLIEDLNLLDWPEYIKSMQTNWIGKKEGFLINFFINKKYIQLYINNYLNINNIKYAIISYESKYLKKMSFFLNFKLKIKKFLKDIFNEKIFSLNYSSLNKKLLFTGLYFFNYTNGNKIPLFISNYYLTNFNEIVFCSENLSYNNYYEIKKKNINLNFKIKNSLFLKFSLLINNYLYFFFFLNYIIISIKQNKYNLKDWIFSRQRFWGESIPIYYDINNFIYHYKEEDLPVKITFQKKYKKNNEIYFIYNKNDLFFIKNNKIYYKEINTMPQWAGSCWYYLRYIDSMNNEKIFTNSLEKYWMPVDLYIGGIEHAVLHLLYSRFWHKVLYDLFIVNTKEPFLKLFNPGIILFNSFSDDSGKYYKEKDIIKKNNDFFLKNNNLIKINVKLEKMSKSKFNVVNPDEIIEKYGADCLRIYELFLGPLNKKKIWDNSGLKGISRFLNKIWDFIIDSDKRISSKILLEEERNNDIDIFILLEKVEKDLNILKFNTCISNIMIYLNKNYSNNTINKKKIEILLKILYPFCPHICEEIWYLLGNNKLLIFCEWPVKNE